MAKGNRELIDVVSDLPLLFISFKIKEMTARQIVYVLDGTEYTFVLRDPENQVHRIANGKRFNKEAWETLRDLSEALMAAVFSGYKNVKNGRSGNGQKQAPEGIMLFSPGDLPRMERRGRLAKKTVRH